MIREVAVLAYDVIDEDIQIGLLGHRLSLGSTTMGSQPPGDSLIDVNMRSECASRFGGTLIATSNLAIPVVNRDMGYLLYVFMMAKPIPSHTISPIRIGYTLQ